MATVRDNPAEHRYEIHEGTVLAGFVTYERRDRTMTFVHTETEPGHEGKGIARQLVTTALAEARANGLGVLPRCPYVRKIIADNPAEYLDLVPSGARAAFGLPAD